MYFINKFITVFTALSLASDSLASIFRNENENEEKSISGFTATHLLRSSLTIPIEKKEKRLKRNTKRVLERAPTNLFAAISRVLQEECCCCSDNDTLTPSPTSHPTSSSSSSPSSSPTANPTYRYSEKGLVASDGETSDMFGSGCSMIDDLVVIGAVGVDGYTGAAYLFRLDGTEVSKLEPVSDEAGIHGFGAYNSIDEKVVLSGVKDYVEIFSQEGIHESTLTCNECSLYATDTGYLTPGFGGPVATHGDKFVTRSTQGKDAGDDLRIYTTNGDLLKQFEHVDLIQGLAMSEQYIVMSTVDAIDTKNGIKTFVYSNVSPDFTKIAEIDEGGNSVAVSGDKLVIGHATANTAHLYSIDGELIKELEYDSSTDLTFGTSVAITDNKIIIGTNENDGDAGSVFIYSIEGEFIGRITEPDAEAGNQFGGSVCASGSYFVAGSPFDDENTGAAYLFILPS